MSLQIYIHTHTHEQAQINIRIDAHNPLHTNDIKKIPINYDDLLIK